MVSGEQASNAAPAAGSGQSASLPPWYRTLFSHGFRPFFLGASVYAALAVAAWGMWLAIHAAGGALAYLTIAEPPHLWHAHEMIFGYGAAAVSGFLLTAVPNWTGGERLGGQALAPIFGLWLAGRAAMWLTAILPDLLTTVVEVSFLPVLGILIWRKFAARLNPRNFIFLFLVGVLALANGVFHAERLGLIAGGMELGGRMGLGTLVVLVTIVGGRTIPGFTRNALVRRGIEDRLPRRHGVLDAAAILSVVIFFILWCADLPGVVSGGVALTAAIANGARLALWRTARILDDPLVWVLHLGYGWIVVSLLVVALALGTGVGSEVAGLHGFGTGVVGTMTMAIMSRASLGHSGRPLIAPRAVVVAYLLVTLAAVLRALSPLLLPEFYMELILASAGAWIAAFATFAFALAPVLLTPRVSAKTPGP